MPANYSRGPFGLPGYQPALNTLGPYDDLFAGAALSARWHLRNTAGVTVSGGAAHLTMAAQKDMVYQTPAVFPSSPLRVLGHFKNLSAANGMVGLAILNSSYNGGLFSPYDGNAYCFTVTDGAWVSSGTSVAQPSNLGDYWIELYWTGTQVKGRCVNHNTSWASYRDVVWGSYTALATPTVGSGYDRFGILKGYVNGTQTVDIVEFRVTAG